MIYYTIPGTNESRVINNKYIFGEQVTINGLTGIIVKISVTFNNILYLINDLDYPNEFIEVNEDEIWKENK